jgi:hypothetical protein
MIARYRANRELRVKKNPYKNIRKHYAAMISEHSEVHTDTAEYKAQLREKVRRKLRQDKLKTIVLNYILAFLILMAFYFMWHIFFRK